MKMSKFHKGTAKVDYDIVFTSGKSRGDRVHSPYAGPLYPFLSTFVLSLPFSISATLNISFSVTPYPVLSLFSPFL